MKLEVGKYYKTRDGHLVLVNDLNKLTGWFRGVLIDGREPFCNFHFFSNGTNIGEGEEFRWADLIAEWTDTPTIGTLAEIGAQVGDVVEYTAVGESHWKPRVFTFAGWDGDAPYDTEQEFGGVERLRTDDKALFRIVSRSQPKGSVITETVKRIVPGDYGRVRVNWCDGDKVCFQLRGDHWAAAVKFSRADLIAARAVFDQLIDAMPEE